MTSHINQPRVQIRRKDSVLEAILSALNTNQVEYMDTTEDADKGVLLKFKVNSNPNYTLLRDRYGVIDILDDNGSLRRTLRPTESGDCLISELGEQLIRLASYSDSIHNSTSLDHNFAPEQGKAALLTRVEVTLENENCTVSANTIQLPDNDNGFGSYTQFDIRSENDEISIKVFPGIDRIKGNLDEVKQLTIKMGNTPEETYGFRDLDNEPNTLKDLVKSLMTKSLQGSKESDLAKIKHQGVRDVAKKLLEIKSALKAPPDVDIKDSINLPSDPLMSSNNMIKNMRELKAHAAKGRDAAARSLELAQTERKDLKVAEKEIMRAIGELTDNIYGRFWKNGLLKNFDNLEKRVNKYQRKQARWQSKRAKYTADKYETRKRTKKLRSTHRARLEDNEAKGKEYSQVLEESKRIRGELNAKLDLLNVGIETFRDKLTNRAPAGTILGKISRTATNLFLSALAGKYSFWALAAGVVGATYAGMTAGSWLFSLLGL